MAGNGRVEEHRWSSEGGKLIIQSIVRSATPWKDGLRPQQLEIVSLVLDGIDFLYIDATGSGKSCAFSIPIVILNEYNKSPETYGMGYRTKEKPVGLVITPTKGLGYNLVRTQNPSQWILMITT
jgi:superfamily II DNA helicase RecQ